MGDDAAGLDASVFDDILMRGGADARKELARQLAAFLPTSEPGSKDRETVVAKLIKLADKTSNMRAITFSPASGWSVKRRLEYIGWAREVVEGLRGASPWLEQQFDSAAADAESSVSVRTRAL